MQCDHKKIIVVSICFNSASGYYTSTTIERFALGPNIYPHTRNEGSFPFSLSVFFFLEKSLIIFNGFGREPTFPFNCHHGWAARFLQLGRLASAGQVATPLAVPRLPPCSLGSSAIFFLNHRHSELWVLFDYNVWHSKPKVIWFRMIIEISLF